MTVVIAIPKSIWFNFRYLPLHQAIKLPIWLASNVRIKKMHRGGISLKSVRFNSAHIGFHFADAIDCYGLHTILSISRNAEWIVNGDLHIGRGAIIHVNEGGSLMTGKDFAISGTTSIVCSHRITIGDDVQFSWNSLVMDSDAHKISDKEGNWINQPQEINIGNKVWIAANTTILKGACVGDNCVVAGNSLVNQPICQDNCVIAGIPAKFRKGIGGWEL